MKRSADIAYSKYGSHLAKVKIKIVEGEETGRTWAPNSTVNRPHTRE
jgi:hypothetical protein